MLSDLTIRLLTAAMKQKEVDERITLDDAAVIAIVDKLIKQRKDSIEAFVKANRQDLADKEAAEMQVLQAYLPARLSADEIEAIHEIDALTGRRFERRSPVTGVPAFWTVPTGGCTHIISSRSFAANRSNWIDQDNCMVGILAGDSGCTPTNIPAGGLVNISNAAMPRFNNRAQSMTRTLAHREPITAWADDNGTVHFRRDIYGKDRELGEIGRAHV